MHCEVFGDVAVGRFKDNFLIAVSTTNKIPATAEITDLSKQIKFKFYLHGEKSLGVQEKKMLFSNVT